MAMGSKGGYSAGAGKTGSMWLLATSAKKMNTHALSNLGLSDVGLLCVVHTFNKSTKSFKLPQDDDDDDDDDDDEVMVMMV